MNNELKNYYGKQLSSMNYAYQMAGDPPDYAQYQSFRALATIGQILLLQDDANFYIPRQYRNRIDGFLNYVHNNT